MNDIREKIKALPIYDDGFRHISMRNGREVIIYNLNAKPENEDADFPIHGYCPFMNMHIAWRYDGTGIRPEYDLVSLIESITRYMNIYESGTNNLTSYLYGDALHRSRKDADTVSAINRIACIRIEFKRRQFDD